MVRPSLITLALLAPTCLGAALPVGFRRDEHSAPEQPVTNPGQEQPAVPDPSFSVSGIPPAPIPDGNTGETIKFTEGEDSTVEQGEAAPENKEEEQASAPEQGGTSAGQGGDGVSAGRDGSSPSGVAKEGEASPPQPEGGASSGGASTGQDPEASTSQDGNSPAGVAKEGEGSTAPQAEQATGPAAGNDAAGVTEEDEAATDQQA